MNAESGRPRFRYRFRLLAGMLVLFTPIMVGVAWLLTAESSSSLADASHARSESLARAVAVRIEDWILVEQAEAIELLADRASEVIDTPEVDRLLSGVAEAYNDYEVVVLTDVRGEVLSATHSTRVEPSESDWFATVASGEPIVTSPVERDGNIDWVVAQPVMSGDDVVGVVAAYLDVTRLAEVLNPHLDAFTDVAMLDADGTLVYDTDMGDVADAAAVLEAGGLAETFDNDAIRSVTEGSGSGAAEYTDNEGDDVIGGAAIVEDLGWIVLAEETTDHSLAPVHDQRVRAFQLVGLGIVVAALVAWIFARAKRAR